LAKAGTARRSNCFAYACELDVLILFKSEGFSLTASPSPDPRSSELLDRGGGLSERRKYLSHRDFAPPCNRQEH
jgi:hypothetical protein